MSRALKYDIPGIDRRVSVDEVREKGWEALFAPNLEPPLRLVVEIGFGRGEFLMDLASQNQKAAHIGVEYSFKRVLKMARRLARSEVGNIRLLEAKGEQVVEELLPEASVECFWINFPDPWPKKRHLRRRLIQPALVEKLANRLVPGGLLQIATDHRDYAEWIDEVMAGTAQLENLHAPAPHVAEVAGRMPTAYELEWRAEGRDISYWTYRRPVGERLG